MGTVDDFFELIFRYLFPVIQQLVDDIFAIRDCFVDNDFAECLSMYPENCEFHDQIADEGLQTCSDMLATCLEDEDILLLFPINQVCVGGNCFFDIITLFAATIDQVVCGVWSLIECFYEIDDASLPAIREAFQCIAESQSPFSWFGSAMAEFFEIFEVFYEINNGAVEGLQDSIDFVQTLVQDVQQFGIVLSQSFQTFQNQFNNVLNQFSGLSNTVLTFSSRIFEVEEAIDVINDLIDDIEGEITDIWIDLGFSKYGGNAKKKREDKSVTNSVDLVQGTSNNIPSYDLSSGFILFGNDPCISTFRYDELSNMFYRPIQKYSHPYENQQEFEINKEAKRTKVFFAFFLFSEGFM